MNRALSSFRVIAALATLSWPCLSGRLEAGCADAPDHFEPSDSVLTAVEWSYQYHAALRQVLLASAPSDPYFRVVVMPSFFPEWAISIGRPSAGRASLELIEARKPVYSGKGPRTPGTTTSVADVDAFVAESLRSVLEKLLLDTRPCGTLDGRMGYDGVTYQFSAWLRGRGTLSGETWSPEEATRAGQVVKVVGLLYRIARAEPELPPDAHEQMRALVASLKANVLGDSR